MNKKVLISIVVLIVIAVAVVVFSLIKPKTSLAPAGLDIPEKTIIIKNFSFNPPILTIKAGEKVTWIHDDAAAHDIVSAGLFKSKTMQRGENFEFTFLEAGEYSYHCGIHPSMKGTVIVE